MTRSDKRVWMTWHHSVRSRGMAGHLGLRLHELYLNGNPLLRHLASSVWTVWILVRHRPDIVFLQVSFLLHLLVAIYKKCRCGRVVIVADCHTKALRRTASGLLNALFWPLKRYSFGLTDLTIVSNPGMRTDIEALHDNYLFIPDRIPDGIRIHRSRPKGCVYISSFAVDEPVREIFELAELLQRLKHDLYWTGKVEQAAIAGLDKPDNLHFTGYLPFDAYYDLVGNAECIIALTTEPDTLQSGAYEALGLEVPMVISDSTALREYFSSAAVYSSHDPADLFRNVCHAIDGRDALIAEIRSVKAQRNREFALLIDRLNREIEARMAPGMV